MIDLTVSHYTEREAYDRRRSGSGSITRPSYLGAAFPSRRPPYSPTQYPTVADLCRRAYGSKARAKTVVAAPASGSSMQKRATGNGATQPAAGHRSGFSRREILDEFRGRRQKGVAAR